MKFLGSLLLRRRNTRYKNPQHIAQHCFVVSFGRCFPFFTMHDQLVALKNICCMLKKFFAKSRARIYFVQQFWLCCLFFIKLTTCHATNLFMLRDKLRVFFLSFPFVFFPGIPREPAPGSYKGNGLGQESTPKTMKINSNPFSFSRFLSLHNSKTVSSTLTKGCLSLFTFIPYFVGTVYLIHRKWIPIIYLSGFFTANNRSYLISQFSLSSA